jgi:TolB-like protein/DNA-binding winged helix-turn-helix (wHTH) protein/Flp pilus assembly protein TadD
LGSHETALPDAAAPTVSPAVALRFGPFELRPGTGELLKKGVPVHLRPQSLQVLALLAGRSGQLVTREEIQAKVWGNGTFVDFEQGLNHCIKEIRAAIGDHAEAPVYVETLARRGYRFIVPVERPGPSSRRWPRWWLLGAALVAVGALALGLSLSRSGPALSGKVMIAVLPLENLSGDSEQDYFADGLTEEIIAQLGRLDPARLGVVGRIPVREYQRDPRGFEAMGRELGVRYVLSGSVRRSGDRVRITTDLTQVSDKQQVWTETYDRELRDILSVQRSVAEAVGGRVLLAFAGRERPGTSQVNPEAYTLFLKGRYFWNRRDGAGLKKSIKYFEQSIAREADYAMAYAGLAQAYVTMGQRLPVSPAEYARKARLAALKALELDGELAEARVALAAVMGVYEWDWKGAEREFRRALELNPSHATGHHWYSHILRSQGRLEEALQRSRTAATLAPVSLIIGTDLGNMLLYTGDTEAARRQYQSIIEMDPRFAPAHRGMGRFYLMKGLAREAVASFERAASLSDNQRYQAWLAYAYLRASRQDDARAILDGLDPPPAGCAYDVATIHAGLGQRASALDLLERAYRDREPALHYLMIDERLEKLRSDPGLLSLARRIGLSAS